MPPVSAEAKAAGLVEYDRTGSIRKGAAAAGFSFGAMKRAILARQKSPRGDFSDRPAVERSEDDKGNAEIAFASDKEIRTLDDAVAFAKVDLSVWRVKRWECGGWNVAMKLKSGKEEAPVKKQLWRVRLYLERILPKPLADATDAVFARIREKAPAYAPSYATPDRPVMAVMDLHDVHFGKLAWRRDCGQDYDLKIADRVYRDAVRDMLALASPYGVEQFLVPIGSDFLHVDGLSGETTGGTRVDADGRTAKIVEAAEMAVVWAVEAMAAVAPVRLCYVPGNHDWILSLMLARTVAARFHGHPGVTVDTEPTARKYHRYHRTLIGFTHGDKVKAGSLPAIMATEAPAEWAATDCREWHTGHLHKSKRIDHLALDTHGGVPVRTLRSLSAVDAWHFENGFIGSQRSAEVYLYSRTGYLGHFVANVRDDSRGAA